MTKNDKVEFAKAITACYMAFDKPADQDQMAVYFDLLSDQNITDVCRAFRAHIKDPDRGRFFPKVADIIYQITGTEKQQDDKLASQIELEWSKSIRAAANGQKPVNVSVYCLSALELIGGANKLGYTIEKEIPFLRKEFAEKYRALVKASPAQIDSSIPHHAELIKNKTQVAINE